MICDYCDEEIFGEPVVVKMRSSADPAGEVGDRYFHDETCYKLYVEDASEYEAVGQYADETE